MFADGRDPPAARGPRRLLVRLDHSGPLVQPVVEHAGPLGPAPPGPSRSAGRGPLDQPVGPAQARSRAQRLPLDQTRSDGAKPQVKPAFRLLGPSAYVTGPTNPGPFTIPSGPSRSATWTGRAVGPTGLDQAPGPRRLGPTPLGHGGDHSHLVQKLGPAGQGPAVGGPGPRLRGPNRNSRGPQRSGSLGHGPDQGSREGGRGQLTPSKHHAAGAVVVTRDRGEQT